MVWDTYEAELVLDRVRGHWGDYLMVTETSEVPAAICVRYRLPCYEYTPLDKPY